MKNLLSLNQRVLARVATSHTAKLLLLMAVTLGGQVTNTLAASGTVVFANHNGSKILNSYTGTPISSSAGVRVALYWSPLGTNAFVQIGATTNVGVPVAGIFAGGMRTCGAETPGGTAGQFQVRAWSGALTTYEQAAITPGILIGQSAVVQVTTGNPGGNPPIWPASLLSGGLASFSLLTNNPPLTVTCSSNKTVECGSLWLFDPPSVTGGCATPSVVITSTVTNGTCPQFWTRTWLITDGCVTNYCSQTVTVAATTPPALVCSSNKTVECGSDWTFDSPQAGNDCSGSNVIVTVLGTVSSGACPQLLTRTWLAVDACGNSNTCSQTVTVVDTTPPALTCATNKTVACGSVWSFDPPGATDACSGSNVTVLVTSTATNGACPEIVTRTWLAVDACGNSNTCSQVVTLVDTTPPTLTCATNKTVECGSVWTFDPPQASDECSGTNVTLSILETLTNGVCPQVFTRSWLALDACGNSNTCSQIVTVVDSSTLAVTCPANKAVSCATNWSFDEPLASSGCGSNVVVLLLDTVTNNFCPQMITRSWNVTNTCNNAATLCTQTVTVLCPDCPVLSVTKACPPHPVPPGGILTFTGTVTNLSGFTLTNVVVFNDKPASNTLVFGPATLAPGASATFAGSYDISAADCGPYADTLLAVGTIPGGLTFSNTVTASCDRATVIVPGDRNGDGVVDQSELNAVLAHYWPSNPWLLITNATGLGGTNVTFALTNSTAGAFSVEYTTNLTDWEYLGPATPRYEFSDTNAPASPQRLYRLRWP